MYLEYLTIHGFKSFANKSTLDFRPAYKKDRVGITAIVGPNGSGKSNVVDAIRWGLGEQSTKTLRGKKSGDVIFAGSDKKTRNSRAEVSIKLNNEDKKIELDYSEIELTRQLFRNGDSDYLINGQKSRLQDIHYLLAQANIGQKSYTVIGQGMIDTVLNSTPQQRKEFFDEAAGIRQYQIKKDQAANKLTASKENLRQGEIQLQEITPRLRSLSRQMKRLEQREIIINSLEEKLHTFYSARWREINDNLKKQLDQKVELDESKNKQQTKLDSLQAKMQTLATTNEGDSDNFLNLQEKYNNLLAKKNELSQKLAELQGRQNNHWSQNGQYSLAVNQQQINSLDGEIEKKQAELKIVEEKIKANESQLKIKTSEQQQTTKEINALKQNIFQNLKPGQQKNNDLLEKTKNKLFDLLKELQSIFLNTAKDENKFNQTIVEIKAELNKLSTTNNEEELKNWQNQLDKLEEEKNNYDQKAGLLNGQLEYLRQTKLNLQNQIKEAREKIGNLQKIIDSKDSSPAQESSRVEQEIKELKAKIKQINTDISAIGGRLTNYNQEQESKKQEIFEKQREALTMQSKINELHQSLTECEIQLAKWQTKKEDLKHTALQDISKNWDELTKHWQTQSFEQKLDLEDLEKEILQLKSKREQIGLIDEETTQEYEEISERHTWLEQQTTDLKQAVESLESVIKNLDEKIENQFTTNIKLINEKFSQYFSLLFKGGKAELKIKRAETILSDEEDEADEDEQGEHSVPDDSIIGIEIMATPPGKRLQNISVLSGGEKALTSIALICAIIANNTSPFVVLDEVDAALDEANSLRFAEILEELSSQTQFIVVTHNRATMEKAQLLYGVTMGDDGVSKLLSIKLEEGKKYTNR